VDQQGNIISIVSETDDITAGGSKNTFGDWPFGVDAVSFVGTGSGNSAANNTRITGTHVFLLHTWMIPT
jgi:hypothetical protein